MSAGFTVLSPSCDSSFQQSVNRLLGLNQKFGLTDPFHSDVETMLMTDITRDLRALIQVPQEYKALANRPTYAPTLVCENNPCLAALACFIASFMGLFFFVGGIGSSIKIAHSEEARHHKILKIGLSAAISALSFVIVWSLLTGLGPKKLAISDDDSTDFLLARIGLSTAACSVIFFLTTLISRQFHCGPSYDPIDAIESQPIESLPPLLKAQLAVRKKLEDQDFIHTSHPIEQARLEWVKNKLKAEIIQSLDRRLKEPTPKSTAAAALVIFKHPVNQLKEPATECSRLL